MNRATWTAHEDSSHLLYTTIYTRIVVRILVDFYYSCLFEEDGGCWWNEAKSCGWAQCPFKFRVFSEPHMLCIARA